MEGYNAKVQESWNSPIDGSPMYVAWEKLKRLQRVMRNLNKPLTTLKKDILKAREDLDMVQQDLNVNLMDREKIHKVHVYTTNLLAITELDEKVMRQKTKLKWLKLGDGNNFYFHASLKSKQAAKGMHILYRDDGSVINSQKEIEQTMIKFYESLMGNAGRNITHVDIVAMRPGPQLIMEQIENLIKHVSVNEVENI